MGKKRFGTYRKTIAAGGLWDLPVFGTGFWILYNSLTTNPEVSLDNEGSFDEIAAGLGPKKLDPFSRLMFRNPSATSAMSLWVAVSTGEIDDNRVVLGDAGAGSDIPVIDTSNTIYSHPGLRVLPDHVLITAGAAVNVGGGVVGIPLTGQTFATGESIVIAGTVNYNATYTVLASSGANQVDITAAYVAEVFTGAETIGLTTPRSITPAATCKELLVWNDHATRNVRWGDSSTYAKGTDPSLPVGVPIIASTAFIIPCTGQIYFAADYDAGVAGCWIQANELRNV
jgi:hypothetical protein